MKEGEGGGSHVIVTNRSRTPDGDQAGEELIAGLRGQGYAGDLLLHTGGRLDERSRCALWAAGASLITTSIGELGAYFDGTAPGGAAAGNEALPPPSTSGGAGGGGGAAL